MPTTAPIELDLLKRLPGHIESHMYEDVQSTGSYVILSQWRSKEEFDAFMAQHKNRPTPPNDQPPPQS